MRWAWFFAMLGCAPSDQLVVWVSSAQLTQDVPGAVADDVERVQLLAGWESWRAYGDWQLVSGWKQMSFGLDAGRYSYVLAVGDQLVPDDRVGESEFVSDPLGQSADPYSTEVSVVTLPPVKQVPSTPPDGLIYQVMVDRFRGAAGALAPPATPGDRAGGTLDGVRAALEAGYFDHARRDHAVALAGLHEPDGEHRRPRRTPLRGLSRLLARASRAPSSRTLGGEAALDALVAVGARARPARAARRRAQSRLPERIPYFVAHSRRSPSIERPDRGSTSWFNDGPDRLRVRRSRLRLGRAHGDAAGSLPTCPISTGAIPTVRRRPAPTIWCGGCSASISTGCASTPCR